MHEYGIAEEIVAVVRRSVETQGGQGATRVVVGFSPGAVEEGSLLTAFDDVKVHTSAWKAKLVLEAMEGQAFCINCATYSVLAPDLSSPGWPSSIAGDGGGNSSCCPKCRGIDTLVTLGVPQVVVKSVEIAL